MTETFMKALTEKNRERYEGYEVPEKLKRISNLITFRFNIFGICDHMYICNCLAYDGGCGDGCGTFTGDTIKDPEKSAEFLQYAYGCNIAKDDIQELAEIIRTADMTMDTAIKGMQKSKEMTLQQKKATQDEWRKGYLDKVAKRFDENIEFIMKYA